LLTLLYFYDILSSGGDCTKSRIKAIRKDAGLTQAAFGERIGITQNYVALIEGGSREPSDRTIRDICREFHVSEAWLRTGAGEMYADKTREELITEEVTRMMATAPDSFKAALIAALLRFDPDGPEWTILEDVYNSVAAELAANPPKE